MLFQVSSAVVLLASSLLATLPPGSNGFVVGSRSSSFHQSLQHPRHDLTSLSLIGYRDRGLLRSDDKDDGDDDSEALVLGRKNSAERVWTGKDNFKPGGEIYFDVIYPEEGVNKKKQPQGAVFFMHGFSQYPVAYSKTLKNTATKANVVVFAVETGLTSKAARGPSLFSNTQFYLQQAVSQDTMQLIQMFQDGEFSKIVSSKVPVGLCGHSMGGGLCFYVAEQFPKLIDYIFAMAPAYGVEDFDPIVATKKTVAANAMLLAGTWDLLAPARKVEQIAVNSNQVEPKSAIYGPIKLGVHTGFEDTLVIITVPLTFLLSIILNLNSIYEKLFLRLLSFLRTNTGQLEISDDLMVFFFQQMVAGKKVTLENANKAIPEKRKEKITLSFPSSSS
ncbi:hypothetical protein ACA910_016132 [Epithemia clementina (nom. ined.)]